MSRFLQSTPAASSSSSPAQRPQPSSSASTGSSASSTDTRAAAVLEATLASAIERDSEQRTRARPSSLSGWSSRNAPGALGSLWPRTESSSDWHEPSSASRYRTSSSPRERPLLGRDPSSEALPSNVAPGWARESSWSEQHSQQQHTGAGNSSSSAGPTNSTVSTGGTGSGSSVADANASHFFPHGSSAFSFLADVHGFGSYTLPQQGLSSSSSASPSAHQSYYQRYRANSSTDLSGWGGSLSGGSWRRRESTGPDSRTSRSTSRRRSLRYAMPSLPHGEKGVVAIAKCAPSSAMQDTVALAGRKYLKILKVSPRRTASESPGDRAAARNSSYPHRTPAGSRSSRPPFRHGLSAESDGAASYSGMRSQSNSQERDDLPPEEVSEYMDLRSGSKLGATYIFSDVRWGVGATANKIATSFTNGAVALWDLAKGSATNKLEQHKHEHDRAVNRLCFGGTSGSWLLSGSQDGQIRVWDTRNRRNDVVLRASSPVLRIAFCPSASQPTTLLACLASGTMIRYDLRFAHLQGGGAIDRIAGHVGPILGMDWRENGEDHSSASSGGWVATGGLDNTVKIWDFNQPNLSSKPSKTLLPSHSVLNVAWHPSHPTELATSPLPALGINETEHTDTSEASLQTSNATPWSTWSNEIAIWDTRQEYYPSHVLQADSAPTGILWNDERTIWSAARSSPVFYQHDVSWDAYSMQDLFACTGTSWSAEGELAFVAPSTSEHHESPKLHEQERAVASIGFVGGLDAAEPSMVPTFEYLATHYVLEGDSFANLCDANAEAARRVGREDASSLWRVMGIWLTDPGHSNEGTVDDGAASPAGAGDDGASSSFLRPATDATSASPAQAADAGESAAEASAREDAAQDDSDDEGEDIKPVSRSQMLANKPSDAGSRSLHSDARLSSRLEGSKMETSVSSARGLNSLEVELLQLRLSMARSRLRDLTDVVRSHIEGVLRDHAEKGDLQTSATACCLLATVGVHIDRFFATRTISAYIDLLRRSRMDVAAAKVLRNSNVEPLLDKAQNHITFHSACARCKRVIDAAPYNYCTKCRETVSSCTICGLSAKGLFIFCTACGHGAHADCLSDYSNSFVPPTVEQSRESSRMSTPGTVLIKSWLWEGSYDEYGSDREDDAIQRKAAGMCPAGACGHASCILGQYAPL